MSDSLLNEKELRVADAQRKVDWFDEEYRELQLCPVAGDYIRLEDKLDESDLTPEEEARYDELENLDEARQVNRNGTDRMRANQELVAALEDLTKYRKIKSAGIASQVPPRAQQK